MTNIKDLPQISDTFKVVTHPALVHYSEISKHWMLTALVALGAHQSIFTKYVYDEDVLKELGLGEFINTPEFDLPGVRQSLFQMYAESELKPLPTHTVLARNIDWLSCLVGLTQIEADILHFRILLSRHMPLRDCVKHLGVTDLLHTAHIIARLLGVSCDEVEKSLRPESKMMQIGLLKLSKEMGDLTHSLMIYPTLCDNMYGQFGNRMDIFNSVFNMASASKLAREDYPHLDQDIRVLKTYLDEVLHTKREGVNVLIYGPPGTGKTEFVKMLSKELGRELYEVAMADFYDDDNRLETCKLAQCILSSCEPMPLLMFDEVEDGFRNIGGGVNSGVVGHKGYINKMLESNLVPTFWLSNQIDGLDDAYIRRFDYVIQINTPPRSVRAKILNQYLGKIVSNPKWLEQIADHSYLNPALVERAAKVIEVAGAHQGDLLVEPALEKILGNTMEAMGMGRVPKMPRQESADYRLEAINTDCDIPAVCEGIREFGQGRLCLYGPPGTGKTAFGQFLAKHIDRPLMVRKASDLLGSYVGQTERKMASMFRRAKQDGAVLLLDEADSFLRDRQSARQNWEISGVNEMLTQMESYEGVFIASTNLMTMLDSASLRRFDLKVKFDYLKPEQAWQLFQDTAKLCKVEVSEECHAALTHMKILTPGDFSNLLRQSRLRRIGASMDLIRLLEGECKLKPEGAKRTIGF